MAPPRGRATALTFGLAVSAGQPTDRHLVTSSTTFTRNYPYTGWERSFYDVARFDAYSTEFRLAEFFDTASGVDSWLRVDETVPLRIDYSMGAFGRAVRARLRGQ